jgi:hypothetical protein
VRGNGWMWLPAAGQNSTSGMLGGGNPRCALTVSRLGLKRTWVFTSSEQALRDPAMVSLQLASPKVAARRLESRGIPALHRKFRRGFSVCGARREEPLAITKGSGCSREL